MRPQLRAFCLRTEPWFFTFGRQGRVGASLEASFGLNAMGQAIEAALRQGSCDVGSRDRLPASYCSGFERTLQLRPSSSERLIEPSCKAT
jgi:hypothetical protein